MGHERNNERMRWHNIIYNIPIESQSSWFQDDNRVHMSEKRCVDIPGVTVEDVEVDAQSNDKSAAVND